jgi:GNAT superfamily N-acetyltransferase
LAGLLDNIFWHTLTGPHAHFATGAGEARRYAPGFSPILGFATIDRPDFAALRPYCSPGERFYCGGWSGPMPEGWTLEAESLMCCMRFEDDAMPEADEPVGAERLGAAHAAQAVDLARLTNPGPFGLRTIELGEYYGCFEGGRLIAMAGERMHAGSLREVSGVCTHPDFQGRGHARRLMVKVMRHELARGEVPFLHVMSANATARRLYERLGFRVHHEQVVRVVSLA